MIADLQGVEKYRKSNEEIHTQDPKLTTGADRRLLAFVECGYFSLLRNDFYSLLPLDFTSSGRLLDAGSGTGIETGNFRKMCPKLSIYGVDISEIVLEFALIKKISNSIKYAQAALEFLPFPDDFFDFVTCYEVIEHVEDPLKVIKELYRVTKPGGVCVFSTPNGGSLWGPHLFCRFKRLFGIRGAPVGFDNPRPVGFWINTFNRAGFQIKGKLLNGVAVSFAQHLAVLMPLFIKALEPLRTVPLCNILFCDHARFLIEKPENSLSITDMGKYDDRTSSSFVCPVCHDSLIPKNGVSKCGNGHAFGNNSLGLPDFTMETSHTTKNSPNSSPGEEERTKRKRSVSLKGIFSYITRNVFLYLYTILYAIFLIPLYPIGLIMNRYFKPINRVSPYKWFPIDEKAVEAD